MRSIGGFLLSFLLLPLVLLAQTLTDSELKKLDPRFLPVITSYDKTVSPPEGGLFPQSVMTTNAGERKYLATIITDYPEDVEAEGIHLNSRYKGFATALVTSGELIELAKTESVRYVDVGETLYPLNDLAVSVTGARLLQTGFLNNTRYKGNGVLVCIIDTGIDWKHCDFRDPEDSTKSRILYIWDQTITPAGGETSPAGMNYGVQYTKADIENEIDGTPAGFVREQDINGHGTHVAGTAAGNGSSVAGSKYAGMAPEAGIVVVKGGNGSFSNQSMIDGLTYAKSVADAMGMPMAVNISIGGHANAHDGTGVVERAVDEFSGQGRVVAVSAGNNGTSLIHISGSVPAGSSSQVVLNIPSYTAYSGANNDYLLFDLWFDSNADVSSEVKTPSGYSAVPGTGSSNDGTIYFYNNTDYTFTNGDRRNYLYIYDGNSAQPPKKGNWTLEMTNNSAAEAGYHGWLAASSMSVSVAGGDNKYTVCSPGTATSAVTAASYADKWRWASINGSAYFMGSPDRSDNISSFSSIGPRRDEMAKPDIAAPGQMVASALSSSISANKAYVTPDGRHLLNQGTSMASPVVAGASALLLQQNHNLTSVNIKELLTGGADADLYTGAVPNYIWGYGKLNLFKSMEKNNGSIAEPQKRILAYDSWDSFDGIDIENNQKLAVRFTPEFSGRVTSLYIHTNTLPAITGALYAEIWTCGQSGYPLSKLGKTCLLENPQISWFGWNAVDMSTSDISVTGGVDYCAVVYFTPGTTSSISNDNGTPSSRSMFFDGSSWSQLSGFDLRIRPEISNAMTLHPLAIDGNGSDWLGVPSAIVHDVGYDGGEWVYKGKANDERKDYDSQQPSSDNDITEFRFAQDGTYLYLLARMRDITNINYPHIGGVFSNGSNMAGFIGDDSKSADSNGGQSTELGSPQQYGRMIDIHAALPDKPVIELNDGSGWYQPASGTQTVIIDAVNDVVEARIKLADLGLLPSSSTNVTMATFPNRIGWNNDADATAFSPDGITNAIDVMTESAGETQDAWTRDLLDGRVDFYSSIALSGSALPVTLAYFSACNDAKGVTLKWKTKTETGSYSFGIEKRVSPAALFSAIAEIMAHGNSNAENSYSYYDRANSGGVTEYRLKITDNDGSVKYSETVKIKSGQPSSYSLSQNYPNPFNPSTVLEFSLAKPGKTTLEVYDALGRKAAVLLEGALESGRYKADFDGKGLSSGVYIGVLKSGSYRSTIKMLLIR